MESEDVECNNSSLNITTFPPDIMEPAADRFKRDAIVLSLMGLVVISVNLLIIIAFFIGPRLRSRSANVLIFSQSGSDIFTGLVFVPVYLLESHYQTEILTGYLICYMLFLSLFNLLALSTDRYLALSKPFLHYRIMDLPRTIKVIVSIWLIPLVLTMVPLAWVYKPLDYKMEAMKIYKGITWLFMLVLVIAMSMLYTFVTAKARRTIRAKRQSIGNKSHANMTTLLQKELRVVHLFGLLLFFFVASYLPILYMNLCDLIGYPEMTPIVLQKIALYLLLLNSIVNPILCIYLKKDFYQAIQRLLLCEKHTNNGFRFQSTNTTRGSGGSRDGEMGTTLIGKERMRKQESIDELH